MKRTLKRSFQKVTMSPFNLDRFKSPPHESLSFLLASICRFLTLSDSIAAPLFRLENRRENEGAFRLIPEITIMSGKQNFNSAGAKEAPSLTDTSTNTLQELSSFSRTQLDLLGIYGMSPALTLFGRLSLSTSKFETNTSAANADAEVSGLQGSASGLGDQAIGLNYRLMEFGSRAGGKRVTSLDFQLQIELPFYDTKKNRLESKPIQGDGTTDITLSPFLTVPLNQGAGSRLYLMTGMGYTSRSGGYSAVLPYQLSVTMLPERDGIMLRGGLYGYKSMKSDTAATGTLVADGTSVRDAGGIYVVDALNSSYMAFRGLIGYQTIDATQYYLGLTSLLSGTSTAALTAVHLGMQMRWGAGAGSSPSSRKMAPSSGAVRYNLQAQVVKAKPEARLAQINKGEADGIEVGQTFDFFRIENGKLIRVARGSVIKVAPKAANLSIQQTFQQTLIQPGLLVRRIAP